MTREEADVLQETINGYLELRESEDKRKRQISKVLKMQLAAFIEPLIPTVKLEGKGMDLTALATPFLSLLGYDILDAKSYVPVVDGREDAPEDMDEEEYERLYCIEVPGDITKEALNIRSSKSMFEMTMENQEEREGE